MFECARQSLKEHQITKLATAEAKCTSGVVLWLVHSYGVGSPGECYLWQKQVGKCISETILKIAKVALIWVRNKSSPVCDSFICTPAFSELTL